MELKSGMEGYIMYTMENWSAEVAGPCGDICKKNLNRMLHM